MTVPTRFVKAKVDKYIQLYSKFAKNEGTTYDKVYEIAILQAGTGFSTTSPPIITFSPHPPGSTNINATAVCTVSVVNGPIAFVTITNPGSGYTTAPTITLTVGGTVITSAVLKAFINIQKRRVFEWDLENAIEINENALIQAVDRVYINTSTTSVYTMRLLDISTQSVINTTDKSGIPNQPSFNQGKVIDIGYGIRTTSNDIKLEIQPQTINKIVISVDEGISKNNGINGDIEFYISLKIVEKEPSVIEYGTLNNINTSQI
jgi:hypothetical protein